MRLTSIVIIQKLTRRKNLHDKMKTLNAHLTVPDYNRDSVLIPFLVRKPNLHRTAKCYWYSNTKNNFHAARHYDGHVVT